MIKELKSDYENRLRLRWPNTQFRIIKFTRGDKPIKIACGKNHKFHLTNASTLLLKKRKNFCPICAGFLDRSRHKNTGRLDLYEYRYFTRKELLSGEWITLFKPYNGYQIRYLKRGKWEIQSSNGILIKGEDNSGYYYYNLSFKTDSKSKIKSFKLHRIVFAMSNHRPEHFIYDGKYQIDHRDINSHNNRPSNLRLATKDLQQRNRHRSKIKNLKDAVEIFELSNKGYSQKDIADKFGCNQSSISRILKGIAHKKLGEKAKNHI